MKRVVIANFYPVWPPITGGQRRVFFLARELSRAFDVEIVVPERQGTNGTTLFTPSFRETRVAVEARYRLLEQTVEAEATLSADAAYALHWEACELYNTVLAERLATADAAVTEHPYSIGPLLSARRNEALPILLDAHNVEVRQKGPIFATAPRLLEAIAAAETLAARSSALIAACSSQDADDFVMRYTVDPSRLAVIANGVDALGVPILPEDRRVAIRSRLGLENRIGAVFAGSFHQPNLKAVDRVIDFARENPAILFVVLGGVSGHAPLSGPTCPDNVLSLGEVDETLKWMILQVCDIGLNPMESGSGTNIKMFEYAAAGLAVLSTPFGARGIDVGPDSPLMVREIDAMRDELIRLRLADRPTLQAMGRRARQEVIATADWTVIGRRYVAAVQRALDV